MPYRSIENPSVDIPWTPLPLGSNWVQFDASGIYLPRYKKINGVVYTSGLPRLNVADNSGGYIVIASLPSSCWPNYVSTLPLAWSANGGVVVVLTFDGKFQTTGPIPVNQSIWLTHSFAI